MLEFTLNRLNEINEKLGKRIKELEAELEKSRWIPVSESLPNTMKPILFCWRPIDYQQMPHHKEIVVGTFNYTDEQGLHIHTPEKVWVNGKYYDIKTHITHWMPIILP